MNKEKLYKDIASSTPILERGLVRCNECGFETKVDSAESIEKGWPKHCGYTMRLVSIGE